MADDAHTYPSPGGLEAGVWPKVEDRYHHFQIVGANGRALAVLDAGGFIDIGGVHVYDPDHLYQLADRIADLAKIHRKRTAA